MDGGHGVPQHFLQDGQVDGVADRDLSLLRLALGQKKGREAKGFDEQRRHLYFYILSCHMSGSGISHRVTY